MGIEIEDFVDPSHVSRQFICVICQDVVDPVVSTPCEHLFCETCLLDWLDSRPAGMETCPCCNQTFDAELVKPPGRIILSILGDLQRYCTNRKRGCEWQGPLSESKSHMPNCAHASPEDTIEMLRTKVDERDQTIRELLQQVSELGASMEEMASQLQVEHARNRELTDVVHALREEALDRCAAAGPPQRAESKIDMADMNDVQRIQVLRAAHEALDKASPSRQSSRIDTGASGW